MLGRERLVSTLCLTATLALLAFVLVSPIRGSGVVTASSRSNCLHRDFVLPPCQPATRFTGAIATDGVLERNALPPENDEQDRADALDEPQASFPVPCCFRKLPDRHLSAPLSILSNYPLRC
jgi:hypothetical protein